MKRFDTSPEELQQNPDQEQHSQRIEAPDRPMCVTEREVRLGGGYAKR